jgi:hypothetical protein
MSFSDHSKEKRAPTRAIPLLLALAVYPTRGDLVLEVGANSEQGYE